MSASPYDRVRVEDPASRGQITVTRAVAEKKNLKEVHGKAVDSDGRPLAAKHRSDKAGTQPPAPRQAAPSAADKPKES